MTAAPPRSGPDAGLPDPISRWAASGAMALTGRADRPPLGPPRDLVTAVDRLADGLVPGDPLRLLGERAALAGLSRRAPASCGGAARLLRAGDGWVAVSLARPSDLELLAAWLELDHPLSAVTATDEIWAEVGRHVAERDTASLHARAALLALPAAAVGAESAHGREGVVAVRGAAGRRARAVDGALVVDLSSLWAGPLCGQVLAAHGALVVKVESAARPDGARFGERGFFDLLNGTKRSVVVDLADPTGRAILGRLVERADVVLEASRPRALDQLGFGADALLGAGWSGVWVSITGYGRSGPDAMRVAFGDDAAAAGGLVVTDDGVPCFCADAVADPLSGLAAARACIDALATDGTWLLDVAMAGVAAAAAGPTVAVPPGIVARAPRARAASAPAPPLGADTAAVLRDLGIEP